MFLLVRVSKVKSTHGDRAVLQTHACGAMTLTVFTVLVMKMRVLGIFAFLLFSLLPTLFVLLFVKQQYSLPVLK